MVTGAEEATVVLPHASWSRWYEPGALTSQSRRRASQLWERERVSPPVLSLFSLGQLTHCVRPP